MPRLTPHAPIPLTQERLRSLLHYDPVTGIFTRLVKRGGSPVGARAGTPHGEGYIKIMVDGRMYLAHRLAWLYVHGEFPPSGLDHIDGVRDHNWLANLRPATQSENSRNTKRHCDNRSGFKGVTPIKDGSRFRAQIRVHGKNVSLGTFKTAEEASECYQRAAHAHYREFSPRCSLDTPSAPSP